MVCCSTLSSGVNVAITSLLLPSIHKSKTLFSTLSCAESYSLLNKFSSPVVPPCFLSANDIVITFSVSALLMMVTLKKLASTGCTLIFTIYQSSTEVFGLFDRICLLSNGNTLFFGETLACLQVLCLQK